MICVLVEVSNTNEINIDMNNNKCVAFLPELPQIYGKGGHYYNHSSTKHS